MSDFIGDWHALLVLLLAGFLPNEVWRMVGLWFGGGVDEELGDTGVGEGGGHRDPRRRHRANPGAAARRARQRSRTRCAMARSLSGFVVFVLVAALDLCSAWSCGELVMVTRQIRGSVDCGDRSVSALYDCVNACLAQKTGVGRRQ